MSAPVNIAKVIKYVTGRDPTINNEMLVKLAGGTNSEWIACMKGQKAQIIVRMVNPALKDAGWQLCSEGVGSEQWQLVSVAEAHRRTAEFNLNRIDGAYRRAHDAVEAITLDERAPDKMREDAKAWLELFEEPRTEMGLSIMREFAVELAGETLAHKEPLMLIGAQT